MTPVLEERERVRLAREDATELRQRARDVKSSWHHGLFAAGRVFLGLVLIGSAASMFADYSETVASLQETVIDLHQWVWLGLALQLAGGAAIALGFHTRKAAFATAAYVVALLLLVPPDLSSDLGRATGFANLTLVSALAMVAAHGAGLLSLDHVFEKRRIHRLNLRAHPTHP